MEQKGKNYYSEDEQPETSFITSVSLNRDKVQYWGLYPFAIPAIKSMTAIAIHPKVTFIVGENGAGKSTLVEGIAVRLGFNPEGGSRDYKFATRDTHSELHRFLEPVYGDVKPKDGYFLRAESFYNLSTEIENMDEVSLFYDQAILSKGLGGSFHTRSHGEAFLALAMHRFRGRGIYILDEPESALSPTRLISLLYIIHRLASELQSQFIISTHSPILMAYPESYIYKLDDTGISQVSYEETEHYCVTRDFLQNRDYYLRQIMTVDQETLDI